MTRTSSAIADHLAVVLGLGLLARLEVDARELRDAVDEPRDLVAELGADMIERGLGVLDDIVEQRGDYGRVVQVQAGADLRDRERMDDEILAERRVCPSWACSANAKARAIRSVSAPGCTR